MINIAQSNPMPLFSQCKEDRCNLIIKILKNEDEGTVILAVDTIAVPQRKKRSLSIKQNSINNGDRSHHNYNSKIIKSVNNRSMNNTNIIDSHIQDKHLPEDIN